MNRASIPFLCLILAGCETIEDRLAKRDSDQPAERIEATKAMEELLNEEETRRRKTGEGLSARGRGFLEQLAACATVPAGDPDPQVRAACLAALGRSPSWTDTAVFRNALRDPNWRCRWEAIHALRLKEDRGAALEVIMLLQSPKELLIRLEAIQYVRDLAVKEAIPALFDIVTNDLEWSRSGTAAWLALKELSGQEFSSDNAPAWRRWYQSYRGDASPQVSPSGEGSTPADGNGSGGELPPAKR